MAIGTILEYRGRLHTAVSPYLRRHGACINDRLVLRDRLVCTTHKITLVRLVTLWARGGECCSLLGTLILQYWVLIQLRRILFISAVHALV